MYFLTYRSEADLFHSISVRIKGCEPWQNALQKPYSLSQRILRRENHCLIGP